MTDLAALQTHVMNLQDVENIKKLKAKYWRCCDQKLWEELATCFASDPYANYLDEHVFHSVEEIVAYLKADPQLSITAFHHGHNPEITLVGDAKAHGIWQFYVHIHMASKKANTTLTMAGYYEDEYIKDQGQWKIKTTKATATFTQTRNE
jgi:hypothetical protein